jgi:predicted CXXCH cytochrome family protein
MHRKYKISDAKAPKGWPLDKARTLSCVTCHDCKGGSCILRLKKEELCRACHDCTQGMACLIGTAHVGDSKELGARISDCEACHDGTVGPLIVTKVMGAHPVGVIYGRQKSLRNNPRDARIVLVNGKVTCVSCHDPYSRKDKKLVMGNENSKLCLSCHNR